MINFDFKQHFQKLKEAPDKLSESFIERDWSKYYDTLSKEEQQEFKAAFNEYLRNQNIQYKEQIEIGKEMMRNAGITIS
ncbi:MULTISPECIES: hypothetical protein [unclassified Arcicella]|uniref:hypothetical protein n=1 Tax=unclassified Arcicella TaxID=2644986 RepID=UPI0028570748|nr:MULTISPECIES: hypothetical protein [unclassified Arcicella]MDR6562802.1 ABC-type transporter MlaC component [Arcicella sp. BE51]MDR6812854.1 ABC-type transporter MlaC component [Arcicella sp. BE140]MDR6824168.1 ABC-type transporter MlaC component [Arcicella sp. BE139]